MFPHIGNVIIPTDFHIFQGVGTVYHQPVIPNYIPFGKLT